jgi:DNA-directed RNA polymerase specialized sigma24 family protein
MIQFKISTWLYRISLNVAISFYRKSSTRAKKYTVLNEQTVEMPMKKNRKMNSNSNLLEQFINELKEIDKALDDIVFGRQKPH